MTPTEIFAPDALAGQVAIVTGGGTNLGRAAAAELAACGMQALDGHLGDSKAATVSDDASM